MLESLKNWISRLVSPSEWRAVKAWAEENRYTFSRSPEMGGIIIGGRTEEVTWQLEWGPSQRQYIPGRELRIRAALATPADLQMLVMPNQLIVALEKETFERYTENLQTVIDHDTPEEMRWLVLFPKLPASELRSLRQCGFEAVGSAPPLVQQWAEGEISSALEEAVAQWLKPEDPLVLMMLRSRLVLRTSMPKLDVARLAAVFKLFERSLRETLRMLAETPEFTNSSVGALGIWKASEPAAGPAMDA